jgi:hypothetical protein
MGKWFGPDIVALSVPIACEYTRRRALGSFVPSPQQRGCSQPRRACLVSLTQMWCLDGAWGQDCMLCVRVRILHDLVEIGLR